MNKEGEILVDVMKTIYALKAELAQLIPNILSGLIILVLGVFFAYILKWSSSIVVNWLLRLLPKNIGRREFIKNNFEPLVLGTGRIFFFVTVFISIAISLKKMGLLLVSEWMQNLGKHIPNVIGSLLILYIGWRAKELIEEFTIKALSKADLLYTPVISKTLSWSIFIITILVALQQIGIDMGLIVSVATVLVGVIAAGTALTFALAAKASISDILYCYQLHKYFRVGQSIEVCGKKGTIKSIGPIFVLIETENGNVTIPGNLFNREAVTLPNPGTNKSV